MVIIKLMMMLMVVMMIISVLYFSFKVPISFQQTNRPVPLIYSLNTEFQLTNNLKMFLLDPTSDQVTREDWDFNGVYSEGIY